SDNASCRWTLFQHKWIFKVLLFYQGIFI
ncbi:hypothetical protein ECPA23_5134, partial [Escherichia coli PA23]